MFYNTHKVRCFFWEVQILEGESLECNVLYNILYFYLKTMSVMT